jgi:hypothetical protein
MGRDRAMMRSVIVMLLFLVCATWPVMGATILFDNSKNEQAGNADWVIDNNFPLPQPMQPTGPDSWLGALSSWGYELYLRGHTLTTLPPTSEITYGNSSNPYDLSVFDLFIVPEPQNLLTAAEKQAVLNFVSNGGGLFIIGNHSGSDRDNDGYDSSQVLNDLNIKDYFGMQFNSSNVSGITTNRNTLHPVISTTTYGPVTTLSMHGGNTLTLFPTLNSSVEGLFWVSGSPQGETNVLVAACTYGLGHVVCFTDSSPMDDGTGNPGNDLYPNWGDPEATHAAFFLSATAYLLGLEEQNTTPTITLAGHHPEHPTYYNPVVLFAHIADTTGEVAGASALYKTSVNEEFTTLTMDLISGTTKDGVWKASTSIPPQTSGTLVSYYITALDDGTPPLSVVAPPGAPVALYSYLVSGSDALDISGWKIEQQNSAATVLLPPDISLRPKEYLIIGRDSDQEAFEAFWGVTLGPDVQYIRSTSLSGGQEFPTINGGETYTLKNTDDLIADGPTIAIESNQSVQRLNPADPAGQIASWLVTDASGASPGAGAGTPSNAGVVINEFSDASGSGNYVYEFIELYYDAEYAFPPQIVSVSENSNGRTLVQGDVLTVTLLGDSGSTASFDISSVAHELAMHETSPGTYTGSFLVPWGIRVINAPVLGRLENAYGASEQYATTSVTIDSGETISIGGFGVWSFSDTISPFRAPDAEFDQGLRLTALSNTDTFGFWQSPVDTPVVSESVYRAVFRISTDIEDRTQVPQLRLRFVSATGMMSFSLVVESSAAGDASPTPEGQQYEVYFSPSCLPEGEKLGLAFDLVSFNPFDATPATVQLDSVELVRLSRAAFTNATLLKQYTFDEDEEGWSFNSVPYAFASPEPAYSDGKLVLQATNNTNTFGYWVSPVEVTLTDGYLYRATSIVSTDTGDRSRVADVRLRLMTENSQLAGALGIHSAGAGDCSPTPLGVTYELYLAPLPESIAAPFNHCVTAFDILNFDPNDDATGTLILDSMVIEELVPPEFP